MKCVMILDKDLPGGAAANTAAVLGVSLSGRIEGLVGGSIADLNGRVHEGVTNIPIPILAVTKEELKHLYDKTMEKDDREIMLIGFSDVAQKSQSYNDYEASLSVKGKEQINYLGLCIYGPKSKVNKLTGSFRMLR